jgi:serine/threonine protein kinase
MNTPELIGQVLDDKYRIERLLGKGGMGAVYLATHLGTERLVALKVIAPQFMMNDEFVARFKREARAAGRFRHPNVVDVTDFGFSHAGNDRIAYLVMEYLDGCTLAEVLAEESRLPLEWVTDILEQACSAVDEAHKQGVIHRDLKPDNIWLEPNRRGGYTVKVLDFGLAKLGDAATADELPAATLQSQIPSERAASPALSLRPDQAFHEAATQVQPAPIAEEQETRILLQELEPENDLQEEAATQILPPDDEGVTLLQPSADAAKSRTPVAHHKTIDEARARETAPADGLTRVGSILGTPLYMSPEQCRSEPLDPRSDIYSFGVIAYQMLTGSPPFTGDMHEVMRQHIEAVPPPLKKKSKKVPKKTAAIVMQALAKKPEDRPSSAAGFSSALRASAEGTGTLLRRTLALYSEHFPKFFRASLLTYLPLIALSLITLVAGILEYRGSISQVNANIIFISLSVLKTILTFIVSTIIVGVTIRLVTQLFLAPLRPLELRPAFAALKKRLRPFLSTTFIFVLLTLLRFLPLIIPIVLLQVLGNNLIVRLLLAFAILLLCIPGILFYINSSLTASIVMMENMKGRAAIRRSKTLVKRSRRTVIAILFLQYIIPMLAGSLVMAVLLNFFKGLPKGQASLFGQITEVFTTLLNVLLVPLIATLSALLYLKTRQMGGETLREALSQFEEEDVPQTNWQRRMRERLQTPTHISRQSNSDKNIDK